MSVQMINASFQPDNLIAGEVEHTEDIVVSGGNFKRGSVLGKLTSTVPATGTAGTNTGNGTLTGVTRTHFTRPGVYTARAISATQFSVFNTKNELIGNAIVGTKFSSFDKEIEFTINAGATPFVANDSFTITVTVGSRQCTLVDSNGTNDGRRTPFCILSEDIDASVAPQNSVGFLSGTFNEQALIFGGTDTIETHRDTLRTLDIFAVLTQEGVYNGN